LPMKAVRFHAQIEDDQTIRPPEGVRLPVGLAEVIVLHPETPDEEPDASAAPQDSLTSRLARLAHEHGIRGLPADLAENHDHYAHGYPLNCRIRSSTWL
jgi:hypothetical protein